MASKNSFDVVVVGSCMIDFVSYAPRLPQVGETIHGTKFVTNFGGKGANQCVAAAKLGATTSLVARVGEDLWGDKYIENLTSLNVDTTHVRKTASQSSGIAQINVSEEGQNQIVIIAGANNKLSIDDVLSAKNVIESAEVLVVQLETPIDVAFAAMKAHSGISILNGAPGMSDYDPELLYLPTVFCVNETEASLFTKMPVRNKREAEIAAEHLCSLGCKNVIITLGAQGAVYAEQMKGNIFYVSSPKVDCVDSTGAGDAFIGALAYLLAKRKDLLLEDIVEIACMVASDSVTRLGTQISFPSKEILDRVPK